MTLVGIALSSSAARVPVVHLLPSCAPIRAALEIAAHGLVERNLGAIVVRGARILRPARRVVVAEATDGEGGFVLMAGGASELLGKPLEDEGIEDGRPGLEFEQERRPDDPAVAATADRLEREAQPLQIAQSRCR